MSDHLATRVKELEAELGAARRVCEAAETLDKFYSDWGVSVTHENRLIREQRQALEEWRRIKAGESNER